MNAFGIFFNNSSPWLIIPCILVALLYSFILYRKPTAWSKSIRYLLSISRFLLVFLIAFLLLSPLIKSISKLVEKPVIVVAVDHSSSILLNRDSLYYKNSFRTELEKALDPLKSDFAIHIVSFGEKVNDNPNWKFNERKTDFSSLMKNLGNRFINRSSGAIILASDGIYNQGSSPLYEKSNLSIPFFSIALGDTMLKKDLMIREIDYNQIVYAGNKFRINITVAGFGIQNESSKLMVKSGDENIFLKELNINSTNFKTEIPIDLDAKKTGIQQFTIALSPVKNELTYKNNVRTIFVEVLDGKQKILLLADAPHPDLTAIKQSIESNKNYEVKIAFPESLPLSTLSDYGLVILHNLPSSEHNINPLIASLKKSLKPCWFILGNNTNLDLFNQLQTGLNILNSRNATNEVQASVKNDFYYFTLTEETTNTISEFPPLLASYGNYSVTGNLNNLLTQKIGSVQSNQPLLCFNSSESKIAILAAEGIWKWRLQNYLLKNNHDAVDELLNKLIQYLSAKEDKRKFRVTTTTSNFDESEPVIFNAELYNDSYELINSSEINIIIKDQAGKQFPFVFTKTEKAYSLNAGSLPAGQYTYSAIVKVGGKSLTANGQFIVSQLQLEELQSNANHQLLYTLSDRSGGKMIYPSEMSTLASLIKQKEDIKPIAYEQKKWEEFINMKWFFFLLLLLLSMEWFIRKREGGY